MGDSPLMLNTLGWGYELVSCFGQQLATVESG